MIDSLLIANRGEIAVRILRTCRRLGVRTIAVYTDVDAHTLHVAEADQALPVTSYLDPTAIVEAARQSRAAAIHPGYGFLAENPDFAREVVEAGLIWVGPPPQAMTALGDKARAKSLAEQLDVPVLPGYHGADQAPDLLGQHAARIGYPMLIKANAGGGGRGMRVVSSAEEFDDSLAAARREALGAFGDDRVLLERYVARPRHIEIQVLGDLQGNLVHLGERECSIQRRHQKLIEESPSPAVSASLRERMGEAAVRLAHAAGYANAGTVEFLLDEEGRFFFLEVNARLQVEHAVTEAVTGLDLVELQLRLAAGEPLPFGQGDITLRGHAIEARVIAEDALSGFLPSTGLVHRFEHPSGVRIDTWIEDGTFVSPYYDSLLAKVIAYASDRVAATRQLASALCGIWLDGLAENIDVVLATLEHPAFVAGDLHTNFLQEHQVVESVGELPAGIIGAVGALDGAVNDGDPWRAQTAWRLGRVDQPANWSRAGRAHAAVLSADLGSPDFLVATSSGEARVRPIGQQHASVDGQTLSVSGHADRRVVHARGQSYRLQRTPPLSVEATAGDRGASGGEDQLSAPMPGRVVRVMVSEGQNVVQNQPLVILEAMKMEHVVVAPHAGVVTEVRVAPGQQVRGGARLLALE